MVTRHGAASPQAGGVTRAAAARQIRVAGAAPRPAEARQAEPAEARQTEPAEARWRQAARRGATASGAPRQAAFCRPPRQATIVSPPRAAVEEIYRYYVWPLTARALTHGPDSCTGCPCGRRRHPRTTGAPRSCPSKTAAATETSPIAAKPTDSAKPNRSNTRCAFLALLPGHPIRTVARTLGWIRGGNCVLD